MDTQHPSAPASRRGVIHVNVPHTTSYVVVGNHLAQHEGLSLTAIGLAVHIQSLPTGTSVTVKDLAGRFPEGEIRIAGALRELEAMRLSEAGPRTAPQRPDHDGDVLVQQPGSVGGLGPGPGPRRSPRASTRARAQGGARPRPYLGPRTSRSHAAPARPGRRAARGVARRGPPTPALRTGRRETGPGRGRLVRHGSHPGGGHPYVDGGPPVDAPAPGGPARPPPDHAPAATRPRTAASGRPAPDPVLRDLRRNGLPRPATGPMPRLRRAGQRARGVTRAARVERHTGWWRPQKCCTSGAAIPTAHRAAAATQCLGSCPSVSTATTPTPAPRLRLMEGHHAARRSSPGTE